MREFSMYVGFRGGSCEQRVEDKGEGSGGARLEKWQNVIYLFQKQLGGFFVYGCQNYYVFGFDFVVFFFLIFRCFQLLVIVVFKEKELQKCRGCVITIEKCYRYLLEQGWGVRGQIFCNMWDCFILWILFNILYNF